MGQRVRVQNFTVSADGYGTGDGQSLERPFGHADPGQLIAWGTATASWPGWAVAGGSRGLDDDFTRDLSNGIGAEIMGRNKFGPQRGPSADLVDDLHIAVAPITLGSGVRLWDSPDELDDRFHHETIPGASGVVHHLLWRRGR